MTKQLYGQNSFKKKQDNFNIISTPGINSLVSDLVSLRCTNDIAMKGSARHCCAIFVEKNQSCFKPYFNGYEPRELQPEKERRRKKSISCNKQYSIRWSRNVQTPQAAQIQETLIIF